MNKKAQLASLILIIGVVAFAALILALLDTPYNKVLKDSCAKENNMLMFKNGVWSCTEDLSLEEDLRYPANTINVRGVSNTPQFVTFVGATEALAFDPNTMEQAFILGQLPHGRLEASPLEFHFHYSSKDTNTGNVSLCVEYTCSNINAVFPSVAYGCVRGELNGTAYLHHLSSPVVYDNDLFYSAICNFRIFRNATASYDTYASDLILLEFDIHYKAVSIGEDIHS